MFANKPLLEESSCASQAQSVNMNELKDDVTENPNAISMDDNSLPPYSPTFTPPMSITDPEDRRILRSTWLWASVISEIVVSVLIFAWTLVDNSGTITRLEAGAYDTDKPTATYVIALAYCLQALMGLVMFIALRNPNDKSLIVCLRVYLVICCIIMVKFACIMLSSIFLTRDALTKGFGRLRIYWSLLNIVLRVPLAMCVHDLLEKYGNVVSSQVSYELKTLKNKQDPQIPLMLADESQPQDGTMETGV